MKRVLSFVGTLAVTAILAGCASRVAPPPMPSAQPMANDDTGPVVQGAVNPGAITTQSLPSSQSIGEGQIFGTDNVFTPNDGSPSSVTTDGIPCASSMVTNMYHIHMFVGILINTAHKALPDGAGMYRPSADQVFSGIPNWTQYAQCYYQLHTHDASGVVHVESASTASKSTASLFSLGAFFDVWRQPLSTTRIGPYSGTVRAYVAQVHPTSGTSPAPAQIPRSAYVLYTSNPRYIPIYTHTSIWLEIGPTYVTPSSFPVLDYYEQW